MPVRNLWSLQPGECMVAEELSQRGFDVYFPVHDTGIDLLAVRGTEHIGIQVKESRYYPEHKRKSGHKGHSWHQIYEKKLRKSRADFYVFLTYLPRHDEHRVSSFKNTFLIVPKSDLDKRITVKASGAKKICSFYFHFEGNRAWDERVTVPLTNKLTDYSEYLDNWSILQQPPTPVKARAQATPVNPPKSSFKSTETALTSLGYSKTGRSKWTRGNRTVYIVRSSEWGTSKIRISWREEWKDYHAIIYDYSPAGGPICIIPPQELFSSSFVSKKRRGQAYANSGYWWSQNFPVNHELARLVAKSEGRWKALE